MGNYSYKDVVYGIPDKYIKMVEKENGREYDGDPGYDGDCWSATAYWINGLEARIAELENGLKAIGQLSVPGQELDIDDCIGVLAEIYQASAALLKEDNQ